MTFSTNKFINAVGKEGKSGGKGHLFSIQYLAIIAEETARFILVQN